MRAAVLLAVCAALLGACGGGPEPQHTPTRAGELHQPGAPVHVAPVRVVPAPNEPEAKADGRVVAGGASCGRERWNVKVATDPAAVNINLTPKKVTVAELGALLSTNNGNLDQPRTEAEQQVYTVTAILEAAKREADSDIHLALRDGSNVMVAEIPDAPACTEPPVTERVSVLEQQIESARIAFVQEFGEPSSTGFTTINHQVTLTGILFFDAPHGQRNDAPNSAELHPVLAVQDP